jgi:protein-tyrosine kinase
MTAPMAADSDEDQPAQPKATNVIPAFVGSVAHPRRDRSMGAILLDAGRITLEEAERILQAQRDQGLRFGDAGKALGLLEHKDIEFALSRQFEYPNLIPGDTKVSEKVVAAFHPSRPQVEALRALRSQLLLRWFDNDPARRALTIVSAASQEGRSYIAANLAVVFSQLAERTLLIDADLRNPCQHELFGVDNRLGLSAVLSGRAGTETVQAIPGLKLSVLPAGAPPPNPQELLARPAFARLLDELATQFDIILLDSPPASLAADAQILTVRTGAALLVARTNATRTWRVQGISDKVLEAKATIVGSVLNDY